MDRSGQTACLQKYESLAFLAWWKAYPTELLSYDIYWWYPKRMLELTVAFVQSLRELISSSEMGQMGYLRGNKNIMYWKLKYRRISSPCKFFKHPKPYFLQLGKRRRKHWTTSVAPSISLPHQFVKQNFVKIDNTLWLDTLIAVNKPSREAAPFSLLLKSLKKFLSWQTVQTKNSTGRGRWNSVLPLSQPSTTFNSTLCYHSRMVNLTLSTNVPADFMRLRWVAHPRKIANWAVQNGLL